MYRISVCTLSWLALAGLGLLLFDATARAESPAPLLSAANSESQLRRALLPETRLLDESKDEDLQKVEKQPAESDDDEAEAEKSDQPDSADEDEEENKEAESSASEADNDSDSEEEADAKKSEEEPDTEKKASKKSSQDDSSKAKKKKEEEKKPEPHKVERNGLKIEVDLDGVFVASDTTEVALRPKVWTQFKVVEAVEHGDHVKKGDVLVRFDEEKIEERLADESLDQRLSELSLMQEEEQFPRVERALELSYDQAKRALEKLEEDIAYFKETERPQRELIAQYYYESAEEELASQLEELEQLEKMYEADDLMEETEEIVLRRQRFQVETAELILGLEESRRAYSLEVMLPRREESFDNALEKEKLDFEQVQSAKSLGLTRERYALEKKRQSRVRSVEKHAKLVGDRALMEIRAPSSGVVYYGQCINGKWSQIGSLKSKLRPFGTVSANSVLMTIVNQRPLTILSSIAEKEFADFSVGLPATIAPAADDELKLSGKVSEIATVPGADKKFAVELDVSTSDAPDWLVAGMTCKTKVTTYENEEAITIPSDMVETDEENEKIKYVMLVDPEDDEPVRRKVKLGRSKDKDVEILKGLEEGDQIVKQEKEEDKEKSSKK